MPTRWVACPIAEIERIDPDGTPCGTVWAPTWYLAVDPGVDPVQVWDDELGDYVTVYGRYSGSNVIELSTKPWALSIVKGVDLSGLDSVPGIVDIFEQDYIDDGTFLDNTFADLGWSNGTLSSFKNKLKQEVPDIVTLTLNDPLWLALQKVGVVVRPDFPGPYGTWVNNPPGD